MRRPRLKTEIWVKAHIRRCGTENVPAVVVRRGEGEAGGVLLKLNRFEHGTIVLVQTTGPDGDQIWTRGTGPEPVPESEADAYLKRQIGYDPDVWVIEIEDREGRHFLDDPVEGEAR